MESCSQRRSWHPFIGEGIGVGTGTRPSPIASLAEAEQHQRSPRPRRMSKSACIPSPGSATSRGKVLHAREKSREGPSQGHVVLHQAAAQPTTRSLAIYYLFNGKSMVLLTINFPTGQTTQTLHLGQSQGADCRQVPRLHSPRFARRHRDRWALGREEAPRISSSSGWRGRYTSRSLDLASWGISNAA